MYYTILYYTILDYTILYYNISYNTSLGRTASDAGSTSWFWTAAARVRLGFEARLEPARATMLSM